MTMLSFLQKIVKPVFGSYEKEEFKKFLRMGLVFALIIGIYWTVRTLKNTIFITLVGAPAICKNRFTIIFVAGHYDL